MHTPMPRRRVAQWEGMEARAPSAKTTTLARWRAPRARGVGAAGSSLQANFQAMRSWSVRQPATTIPRRTHSGQQQQPAACTRRAPLADHVRAWHTCEVRSESNLYCMSCSFFTITHTVSSGQQACTHRRARTLLCCLPSTRSSPRNARPQGATGAHWTPTRNEPGSTGTGKYLAKRDQASAEEIPDRPCPPNKGRKA